MKSPSFIGSIALLIGSVALGCNAILGTTPGTLEGAGGASSSATTSVAGTGGHGGSGGAASSASSTSVSASSAASSSSDASSSSAESSSSAASSSSDASSSSSGGGLCTTDADGDTYISIKCPGGNDCADDDALASPAGDFHTFPITNPPVGTLPFDFNCNGVEQAETPKITCGSDCSSQGFQGTVACGAMAPLGKCTGLAPMCAFQALSPAVSKTQRCK